jgi:hypothetical protein
VVQLSTPGLDADAQPMEQQPDLQQGMACRQSNFMIQWDQASQITITIWICDYLGLVAHCAQQEPLDTFYSI